MVDVGRYSNKSHGAALIIIAWALPTGQIVLISDVFLGRVSEANLVQAHEPWLRVFGAGTFIVADKGASMFASRDVITASTPRALRSCNTEDGPVGCALHSQWKLDAGTDQ